MNPKRRLAYEKFREEVNRQLAPDTPATKRWVTVAGIALCIVVLVNIAIRLPALIVWPADIGLLALWLVDEFSAYQAWQMYAAARSRGANQVALKAQRDALARECLGRAYLLAVYSSVAQVFSPATHWFLLVLAVAGILYIGWLILAFVRVEAQMRAAGKDD